MHWGSLEEGRRCLQVTTERVCVCRFCLCFCLCQCKIYVAYLRPEVVSDASTVLTVNFTDEVRIAFCAHGNHIVGSPHGEWRIPFEEIKRR